MNSTSTLLITYSFFLFHELALQLSYLLLELNTSLIILHLNFFMQFRNYFSFFTFFQLSIKFSSKGVTSRSLFSLYLYPFNPLSLSLSLAQKGSMIPMESNQQFINPEYLCLHTAWVIIFSHKYHSSPHFFGIYHFILLISL